MILTHHGPIKTIIREDCICTGISQNLVTVLLVVLIPEIARHRSLFGAILASIPLVSQPLHFGDYGGMPLKILWAVLTTLTIIVLGSGLYLWIKRRNRSFEDWLQSLQWDDLNRQTAQSGGSLST